MCVCWHGPCILRACLHALVCGGVSEVVSARVCVRAGHLQPGVCRRVTGGYCRRGAGSGVSSSRTRVSVCTCERHVCVSSECAGARARAPLSWLPVVGCLLLPKWTGQLDWSTDLLTALGTGREYAHTHTHTMNTYARVYNKYVYAFVWLIGHVCVCVSCSVCVVFGRTGLGRRAIAAKSWYP